METNVETPLSQPDTDTTRLHGESGAKEVAMRELTALELAFVGGGSSCVTFD
jgi:hypothetical protein